MRNKIYYDNIISFIKLLPQDSTIDIYINTPNRFSEFDNEILSYDTISNYIKVLYDIDQIKNVYINIYDYNPSIFILRSLEFNLPHKNTYNNIYPFRILSLHYSISTLCKLIIDSNKSYDTYILTRFDIFPTITSLGDCINNTSDNTIYIWRTIPYKSNDDAEDRIIIGSNEAMNILSKLYYSDIYNIYNQNPENFCSEKIIGAYVKSQNLIAAEQSNIVIGLSPSLHVKYTTEFEVLCNKLFENTLNAGPRMTYF